MIVKICGLQTAVDAQLAKDCGADWLGFIFAPSRRQVTPDIVRSISDNLTDCLKVGVFVDHSPAEIQEIAAYCRLDLIQLHGRETAADYRQLSLPLIKAYSLDPAGRPGDGGWPSAADYVLLDTVVNGKRGGTGQCFDWNQASTVCRLQTQPILAAGGLTPDNVGAAIRALRPFGVDVAGGVETDGRKDPLKLESFIRAARNAAKEVCSC